LFHKITVKTKPPQYRWLGILNYVVTKKEEYFEDDSDEDLEEKDDGEVEKDLFQSYHQVLVVYNIRGYHY
jgi:hypothetical protein